MPFVSMGCFLNHEGFAQTRSNEKNGGTRRLIRGLNPGGKEVTASGQIVTTTLQPSLHRYTAFLIHTDVTTGGPQFCLSPGCVSLVIGTNSSLIIRKLFVFTGVLNSQLSTLTPQLRRYVRVRVCQTI